LAIGGRKRSLGCKNTAGIDAFYWLSDNVVECQQYKANEIDSKNPTKLTQAELDGEYAKAKNLFDKYLAKFNYQFVFGLVSNRIAEDGLTLQPNMYVVHQGNVEQYYGPLAGVAQIKGREQRCTDDVLLTLFISIYFG
jgi:hypothetical protein